MITFRAMKIASVTFMLLSVSCACLSQVSQTGPVSHFVNGQWFDEQRFVKNDFYCEDGLLTHHPNERRSYQTVDLHDGFVVPPYGDAHEHNFDGIAGADEVVKQYLHDGVFYAQGMTDTTEGAAAVVAAGLVNTPSTPDVTYAHGGLTGVNGHPKEVYESYANGFPYPQTPEQRTLVINSHQREGKAYWEIPDATTLQAEWPAILAAKPDLIKVYLLDSEHYKAATVDDPQLAHGIDPALVPEIVKLAHATHLKVAAHIDTAYDFHVAVAAGVDEMGHLPGYGMNATEDPAKYRLFNADIALAAKRHVKMQATAGIYNDQTTSAVDAAARRALQVDDLTRLKAAGVPVLVGSDHYSQDSVHEADYLQALGVFSNLEMLRMWAVETPQTIFPKRKLGELKPGYEASFLVLPADPLADWTATHKITQEWKQGERLELTAK